MTTKPAQFTPGPWIVEENGVLPDRPYTVGKLLYNVADVGNIYDANLIAAAPAMYEALKGCLRVTEAWKSQAEMDGDTVEIEAAVMEIKRIKTALAQAEGRQA